ncbi:hypothetical protein ABBQ38_014904 [Trebouxia sp. C0009 RCD-2024]
MTLQPRTGTVLHGSLQSATKLGHFCAACRQRQACRNQGTFKVFAMETRNRQANQQARRQSRKKGELPQTGFFAQADPKAQVYIPRGGQDNTDVTKRGGRYTSDFVWNTKWQDQLDRQAAREQEELAESEAPPPAGALSFSRVSGLQSMDVDLTEQLKEAKVKYEQRMKDAAEAAAAATARREEADKTPSSGEVRRWQRSGRYSRKAVPVASVSMKSAEALAAQQAAEAAEYQRLQAELQTWCQGTALACLLATFIFYSKETAASYGLGAVGSLVYLRMLNRSIDGVGGVGAALGQPRLLVPVILTATFNRWNTLAAPDVGLTLQLLPMLLGFFTYKAAVITKTGLSLLDSLSKGSGETSSLAAPGEDATNALGASYSQQILTK